MISDLFDLVHIACTAVVALFNVLDVLNAIYTLGQFACWCVQTVAEFGQDILNAAVHNRR